MGLFKRKGQEIRADTSEVQMDDPLLKALLGGGNVTKDIALQVPAVGGGIDLIANIVASTPIKLYQDNGGKAEEIKDDPRLRLLGDETGDTLNANEFWKAIVRDYYTGKGGYAYINREKGSFKSLHYVDETEISIVKNPDPIFKDFDILVRGHTYKPYDFLKILRNTKDGAQGVPITQESSKLIEIAYQTLCFERNLVKRGGNKRGYLKAQKRVEAGVLSQIREAFRRLYSNDDGENMIVLNADIDFQEASNTSVEMQLNENKLTNAGEFSKIFHISPEVMSGKATEEDTASLAKLAAIPLMITIQCALNKDFLLEKEKGKYYWAFDTKELLKGDMKERFDAYKVALDANFMQIDEVRYAEDLEPLGLSWVKLGLQDVLYDPKTKLLYTPNTNQLNRMEQREIKTIEKGGGENEN
ncbi:phage portal protein [Anaerotruncus rubiinfantis]|jgi:HK97 family phage portal protein|uniref:phage portal protein n=1 Tax=Anaerotruncus rubiinfantis TaxID=1720200 RepID=UPI00082C9597|nr:phage portal protein [Anaerotruncus rubiinfantis]